MGYGEHDPNEAGEPERGFSAWVGTGLTVLARVLGIVVLLVGLWAGIKVLLEGWALYESPARIERLALAIERGSNLDALFATAAPVADAAGEVLDEGGEPPLVQAAAVPDARPTLRLSYFAAWFVALMLLFVIGMLAMSAISAGGNLALRELPSRRISRDVVREVRRLRQAA